MRVALVAPGFAPYRAPLWNALAALCDLRIILLSAKARNRAWAADLDVLKAPVDCLGGPQVVVRRMDWVLNLSIQGIVAALEAHEPHAVVVTSYQSPGFWVAQRWARRRGVPVVIAMGGHTTSTRTSGLPGFGYLKHRFITQCAAGYTYCGRPGQAHLVALGMPSDRIVTGYNGPDPRQFPTCERVGDGGGVPQLLYAGQFLRRKGVPEMLDALALAQDAAWHLTVVGGGPEAPMVRRYAEKLGLSGRIHWRGQVPYDEITSIYRSADVLLFPSLREVWGLVVNEALLSGLFVVATRHAAASQELIVQGENGLLVEPCDKAAFADAIRQAVGNAPYDRNRMRASAARITPDSEGAKLYEAIKLGMAALHSGALT